MVDEFSNYIKGKVIYNKKPETIVKAFNKVWADDVLGIHSKGTMTDNGGEFKNPEFLEMAVWTESLTYSWKLSMVQWQM